MTDKKPTVEEAEAALLDLEKHSHAVALANSALQRAQQDGETSAIKAALDKYSEAVRLQEAANVSPAAIARAAQAVLDARGEAHTETNILPSDHGLTTVVAGRALALAMGEGSAAAIAAAQDDLAESIAVDATDKAAHVADGHARTQAALAKGEV